MLHPLGRAGMNAITPCDVCMNRYRISVKDECGCIVKNISCRRTDDKSNCLAEPPTRDTTRTKTGEQVPVSRGRLPGSSARGRREGFLRRVGGWIRTETLLTHCLDHQHRLDRSRKHQQGKYDLDVFSESMFHLALDRENLATSGPPDRRHADPQTIGSCQQ